MSTGPKIFIVAGEPSGDLIGSQLTTRILEFCPEADVSGIGGEKMEAAGARVHYDIVKDLAIMGFVEVVIKLRKAKRVFDDTRGLIHEIMPDVVVLIDYPGFNLRMAKVAHDLGLKVVYYVIPQVWAWHKSRVNKIREYVDRALVILPFEEEFLRKEGVDANYVGHPLMDVIRITMDRDQVFKQFDLDPNKKLVALLPGSREREVNAVFPVMLEAGEKIQEAIPNIQFVLPRALSVDMEQLEQLLAESSLKVKVIDSFRYNLRAAADFALVTSGTATLETGLLGCPMVIMYRVSFLTYILSKYLATVPYFGLINLVAEDLVVPEFFQDQCTAENVAQACLAILGDDKQLERLEYQLDKVRERVGGPGASRRAAEEVLKLCVPAPSGPDEAPLAPAESSA